MKKIQSLMLVIVLALTNVGATQRMNVSSNDMLSEFEGQDFETAFLSMMIEHHKDAIEMSKWILERTQNADIKAAAEAVIAAQHPEIQQMTAWLQDWYGQSVDAPSAIMMQGDMDTLSNMAADPNPDTAFLEQMSLHHNNAIDMAQVALLKATHLELRDLAKNIIVAQAQEIAQYQTWLETLGTTSQTSQPMQHGSMQHGTSTQSPYIEQLGSAVRGLSQEEVDGLLAGEGMGYARSAELNGYPGPRHVLDLASELQLTTAQQASIQPIFETMNTKAVALGQEIVAAEQDLSAAFEDKSISSTILQTQLSDLANLYTELRQTHLEAHLTVTPLLTEEQLAQYQMLRGYAQN
jgi:uncharacterized protein (DUF305 family)